MKTAQRPNPKAKARQLAEDWEAMMRKHSNQANMHRLDDGLTQLVEFLKSR